MLKNILRKEHNTKKGESTAAFIFMGLSIIGMSVFFLIPFVDTFRRSFFDARGKTFIGLRGYVSVFGNEAFKLASMNTIKFISICIPLLMLVSLVISLLIRSIRPHGRFLKTTYLLPIAIPVAGIVILWQVLFNQRGIINGILTSVGIESIDFISSSAAFWVLIFTYLWKNSGYNMVLWLTGLDGIPITLYETAKVDGVNAWQSFWHITLPDLLPTVGLVFLLSLLNGFKVFREAYLVAGNYPHDSIYLLQHLFNNWFLNLDISRLCVVAVILCIVLLSIILLMQRFLWKVDRT